MELTLFVDHRCNLRCSYCYTGEKFRRPMSRETMLQAVALALDTSHRQLDVSFFGGEPLLHPDFIRDTVEHVEAKLAAANGPKPSLRFILNTNATLVTEEVVELMAPPRRFTVFVSLDGPREVHDRFRVNANGQGSYDLTLCGIERLRDAGIPTQLMLVVGPATAACVGEAVTRALELCPEKIQLNANYRDEWTDESIDALRTGLDRAGDAWMHAARSGQVVPLEPFHSKILSHLKGGIPCPSRCLLGDRELTVTPAGRIYPCPQMVGEDGDPALCIGSLELGLDREKILALQRQKDRALDSCEGCELFPRCQSQCGCRHVALTGELGRISRALCEIEAAYVDAADRVAETLFAEQCAPFIEYYYQRNWAPAEGAALVTLRRSREG